MARHESESSLIPQADPTTIALPQPWADFPAQNLRERLASAGRSILMLDYDGTLAPFVLDRMQATFYPGIAERLALLAREPRVRLAFVSGRGAKELAGLLPPGLNAEIWGAHGRERLSADGVLHTEAVTTAQENSLRWLVRSVEARGFGAEIETKSGSLAFHTRGLDAANGQKLIGLVHMLFTQLHHDAGLDLLPFDHGVEVRAQGCSKADAVARILASEPEQAAAAYLGDDHTDEDAFRALQGRGLSVLVRAEPRASLADLWLRPPDELLAFLDVWQNALAEMRA
jgi:trehalose-phosphatase